MKGTCNVFNTTIVIFYLVFFVSAIPVKECDKSKCKGPIQFYEAGLGCKPIYENDDNCCPLRYDCPYLAANYSKNKCYSKGHEYNIGDKLKEEDRTDSCEICTCVRSSDGSATFICSWDLSIVTKVKEGCYVRNNLNLCHNREVICLESPENRYKCEVNGEIYLDGELFVPEDNSGLYCQCSDGYIGKNVEPFCKPRVCNILTRRYNRVSKDCVPVFYGNIPLRSNCQNFYFKCENEKDILIPKAVEKSLVHTIPNEMKCKFGNLTMNIGDVLYQSTDLNFVCVKCICEVPPIPTCEQPLFDECNIVHELILNLK